MDNETRLLFFKYAYPCVGTLVKRGGVKQEIADRILDSLEKGEVPKEDPRIFAVAHAMCNLLARQFGREIDKAIVREYFQGEHDDAIERRYEEMRDFNPEDCRVHPGKVLNNENEVLTPKGNVKCKSFGEFKEGDWVVIHYNYIIEKVTREKAKDLWEKKKEYVKGFTLFPG